MGKLSSFIRRAGGGSLGRMRRNIRTVHEQSGKSQVGILIDMLGCMRQGFGHLDYLTFNFAEVRDDRRNTFITMNDNIVLARRLNERDYYPVFNDKRKFNAAFRAYLGRDYVDLADGFEAFEAFVRKHPVFIAKPAEEFGGAGIQKIDAAGQDLRALYDSLLEQKEDLAEELLIQHPEMAKLNASSVNTIRVTTVVDDAGTPHFMYAILRVGSGQGVTDNISSGGMYTLLDENGAINYPMFRDKDVSTYEKHPVNGFVFKGFQVPMFRESVELCLKAALVEPHMRYIGWDVAVTADGPVLIEGNHLPGYDMCQNHIFHPDGVGFKPAFEAALGGAPGAGDH